jgi:hypothetical protein
MSPSTTPARRLPVARSLGRKRIASRTTKSGTVAFAIAATPESMYFSPHAINVNGTAALTVPSTRPGRQALASSLSPRPTPSRSSTNGTRSATAMTSRKNIIAAGSISSTATLMKRYDAPQTAARNASIHA